MFEYNTLFFPFRGTGLCLGCADNRTQGSLAGTPLSVIFAIFKKQPNFWEQKRRGSMSLAHLSPRSGLRIAPI